MSRKDWAVAVSIALCAIGLIACGGGESDASGSGAEGGGDDAAFEESRLEMAECLREHGLDVPDPVAGEKGFAIQSTKKGGQGSGMNPDDPATQEAIETCEDEVGFEPPDISPEQEEEMKESMLAFAQCMREHGVDMPDPEFEQGGKVKMRIGGPGGPGESTSRPSKPPRKPARTRCPATAASASKPGREATSSDRSRAAGDCRRRRGACPLRGLRRKRRHGRCSHCDGDRHGQRRTLAERLTVGGTIGYAGESTVLARLSGTLTALPKVGDTVERGERLYALGGEPVLLMYGDVPAYRELAEGIEEGADVEQLERNLAALGYEPGTVDEEFTSSTATAVSAWQEDLGLEATGAVELGRVAFLSGPRRVTEVEATLGEAIGSGVAGAWPRTPRGQSTTTLVAYEEPTVEEGEESPPEEPAQPEEEEGRRGNQEKEEPREEPEETGSRRRNARGLPQPGRSEPGRQRRRRSLRPCLRTDPEDRARRGASSASNSTPTSSRSPTAASGSRCCCRAARKRRVRCGGSSPPKAPAKKRGGAKKPNPASR